MSSTKPCCPLCGTGEVRLHIPARNGGIDARPKEYSCSSMGHGDHNDIYFCAECLHGFLHPFPSSEELNSCYAAVHDELYMQETEGRVQTFSHNLKILKRFSTGKKLLEVGSYCGIFLNLAQADGYQVTGLEPSDWARQQAQNHYQLVLKPGLFTKETCQNQGLLEQEYDQIVSWDVLEHVEDPQAFLKLAHELLKIEGLLVFSTVNIHSWFTKLLGKKWPWYMQMHLHYFTQQGLKKLLEREGFKVLDSGTYQHVISIQYFGKKLKALTGFPFDRLLGNPIFSKCFIPFRFGDIVYVVAQKG